MKKVYTFILLAIVISCSPDKVKEEQQQNLIIQAMTNGQWKVSSFNKGSTDVTVDFSPYKFQFKTDLSVDAINNSTVEKSGSWNADANAQTISSNFTNASNPLMLLNGTWKITNTTWTSVNATQTAGSELHTLRLDKL